MPFLLLILSSAALAGPFTERTSMGPWPETQVEREIVLPRGWLQIGLAADTKSSSGYRGANGAFVAYDGDTRWSTSTLQLQVDQGFAKRISLYARVPVVRDALTNDRGADLSTVALGDIHTGFVVQPWLGKPTAVAFSLDLKSPSGLEWPADYIGGPGDTAGFLTGTGVTNLGPFVHLRQRFGHRATVGLKGGYVWKFPAIVGYVLEDDGWGLGWLDPGNEIRIDGDVAVQIVDALAISAGGRYSHRGIYAIGTKGDGTDGPDLVAIDGSDGAFVDLGGGLSYEPTDHFEIDARVSAQVMGSDTRLFAPLGLEEFSPQPGVTYGLTGVVRW